MTLLEQLAELIYERCGNRIFASWDNVSIERETFIGKANDILSLINSHPETVERRRRDFLAGCNHYADGVATRDEDFNEYLAAEKEQ